jgi:DNA-binding transcriptional LysR family regulator
LNFSQIKCFLAAAECLSFTKAADRLYLSQPVLSRQIAAMEDELGIELFAREKKTIRLTPAGAVLAEGLNKLAHEYRTLLEKAAAVHKGYAGSINIGMIEGQLVCPPYSAALNKARGDYDEADRAAARNFGG